MGITVVVLAGTASASVQNDFFVTGDKNGNVYIFPSNGDGTFANKQLVGNIGNYVMGAAIADFDNDGNLDFTIQTEDGISYLFINDGTGVFAKTKVAEWLSIDRAENAVADFNNDGYYDYVVSGKGAYIYLFTNPAFR
jgi:hypothetical protein